MRLLDVVVAFCEEVEREDERRGRGPGGQQVTPCGDFVGANPSVMRSLRVWAVQMRKALYGGEL